MVGSVRFVPPLEDVAAKFRRLAENGYYEGVRRVADRVDGILLPALQAEAPVSPGIDPRRTPGRLRDSIHSVLTGSGDGSVSKEYRAVDYARYVVGGTQPHDIFPVQARALAFYTATSDGLVFAQHVSHPGTAPNPFPARALEASLPDIQSAMHDAGVEMVDSLL